MLNVDLPCVLKLLLLFLSCMSSPTKPGSCIADFTFTDNKPHIGSTMIIMYTLAHQHLQCCIP